MTTVKDTDCQHAQRVAEIFCGSYFVKCDLCNDTLITIPWFAAETLLRGRLRVNRLESPQREEVAKGAAKKLFPHIRQLLMYQERLALSGPQAVIDEAQLVDIKNNPLAVQQDYFSTAAAANPRDETSLFSLAQVVRELGDEEKANAYFDAGIALANANWLRKLPLFALPSIIVAGIMWLLSLPLWLCAIVTLVGPAVWGYIRRNRKHWLPVVGFHMRAETAAGVDMAAVLSKQNPTR